MPLLSGGSCSPSRRPCSPSSGLLLSSSNCHLFEDLAKVRPFLHIPFSMRAVFALGLYFLGI
jgi:hypothetical protein